MFTCSECGWEFDPAEIDLLELQDGCPECGGDEPPQCPEDSDDYEE